MKFIRTAFEKKNDTRMISIVIDIADYLKVPVIAEGVETEEQYLELKKLGCAIIQGYYFSKPVPADEFERFLNDKKEGKG
jgi:EAL domain-containing protein (putative c-di-GMP-specific phosphodiesterase class I)